MLIIKIHKYILNIMRPLTSKRDIGVYQNGSLSVPNFSFFFFFFRAAPMAYEGSQARGLIGAVAASLCHSHSNAGSQAASSTYTTAQGTAGSLSHWTRPGIEPASSWMLVGFVNYWATTGTPELTSDGCSFLCSPSEWMFQGQDGRRANAKSMLCSSCSLMY